MSKENQQSIQTSPQQKKLWYKKPWVILIGLIIFLVIITKGSENLFIFFMLISAVCFLISWVYPRIFYKLFSRDKTLIRAIFGLALIGSFIIIAIVSEDSDSTKKYSEEVKEVSQDSKQPEKNEDSKEEEQAQVAVKGNAVEYELIETKDLAPNGGYKKKICYKVVVSTEIKEGQVEPTFNKIVADISLKDDDVDEVIIWMYSDKELIGSRIGDI